MGISRIFQANFWPGRWSFCGINATSKCYWFVAHGACNVCGSRGCGTEFKLIDLWLEFSFIFPLHHSRTTLQRLSHHLACLVMVLLTSYHSTTALDQVRKNGACVLVGGFASCCVFPYKEQWISTTAVYGHLICPLRPSL